MKKLTGLSLVLAFGLMLTGCGKDDGVSVSAADLLGKWLFSKQTTKGSITVSMPGYPTDKTVIDTVETLPAGVYFVEYKSDNTFIANLPEDTSGVVMKRSASGYETGTYEVKGSAVNMVSTNSDGGKDTIVVVPSISGNTAKFKLTIDETFDFGGAQVITDVDVILDATKQ